MQPLSEELDYQRWLIAANYLVDYGWRSVGGWLFEKNGKKYDLSAADITKHELIENKGLFLVSGRG